MMHSKAEITAAIKAAVKKIHQNDPESLTVNHVRTVVTEELDLEGDFLKKDPFWKNESKRLTTEEYKRLENGGDEKAESEPEPEEESEEEEVPIKAKKATTKKSDAPRGKKRPSDSGAVVKTSPSKKTKVTKDAPKTKTTKPQPPAEDDSEAEEVVEEAPKKASKATKARPSLKGKRVVSDDIIEDSDEEVAPKQPSTPKKRAPKAKTVSAEEINSDDDVDMEDSEPAISSTPTKAELKEMKSDGESSLTEMSDNDEVKPNKSKKRAPLAKREKAAAKPKAKKEAPVLDPADEKIKVLKDQLGKCGVRKVWGKELKKYETSGEKIRYLQGLLSDVGMTGRFSAEKAKQIKDRRELESELSAIKAGEASWGVGRASRSAGSKLVKAKDREPAAPVVKGYRGLDGMEDLIDSDSD